MAISIIEIDGNSHPLGASADNVAFDGTGTGIEAGTVQEAIEEVSILAAEGAQSGVVDNLETVDGQKALSAGMGNKLDGKASVVFNHMHWPVGSSSPSVGVGSHERYYCPENHTIYHFYGRIYASEPTTTTLSYQPSKEVVYYDLETATAWRWDGTNMVLAVHPPYFMIVDSTSSATIDGYNPATQSVSPYPRLVWFSALSKLVYFYMDGNTRRHVAFDPDPNRVYVRLGSSPKVVQWSGSAWVDVIDISSKANASEVAATYATKSELNTGLAGKQNTLTFDNAPTAGSNNPVKSGGVKTALDNLLANLRIVNGEWYIGNTATGVSAQGPAGNVNITDASQLVAILVNDLTTGGAGNILSAEMGKVLKIAISTLIDSMGDYCFPNGRPTLSWEGAKCNVAQSLTDVTSDFSATKVDKNGSLEITLSPVDNLHVFLTGDVTVEMPLGTDITSTAWNANTGKVTIADVTDDMIITAKSSTYVQSGLVSMFDGKNRGGVTGEWTDVMDNTRKVMMTNCTEANDHVQFSSSSTAYNSNASVGVDVAPDVGTIEAVVSGKDVSSSDVWQYIFTNHYGGVNQRLIIAGIMYSSSFNNAAGLFFAQKINAQESLAYHYAWLCNTSNFSPAYISMSNTRAHLNDSWLTRASDHTGMMVGENSRLALSGLIGTNTGNPVFKGGKIYCIRIYSRQLSESEVLQNYKVDQKRFNLS